LNVVVAEAEKLGGVSPGLGEEAVGEEDEGGEIERQTWR
jgi:hypothetical protein